MDLFRNTRRKAIVRGVAATYDSCIRPHGGDAPIDVARAQKALERARERLATVQEGLDRERARLAKARAQARLGAAKKH